MCSRSLSLEFLHGLPMLRIILLKQSTSFQRRLLELELALFGVSGREKQN